MKIFKIDILILIFLVATVTSCDDPLSKSPLDSPSSDTFFSNSNELELALNGAYNILWWEVSGFGSNPALEHLDLGTDIGFQRGGIGIKEVPVGSATSDTGIFKETWEHFFTGIGRVNNLLQNMSRAEGASPALLERIEAEARFLRAYSYSFLTELYGDVPLLTTVPSLGEAQVGRTSKNEVVDMIMEDLNFASSELPDTWSGADEGRATRGAANTLKARVALFNGDYITASETALEVMNSGIYSLHPDYEEMFMYAGIRNSEVILDAPYQIGIRTHALPRKHGSRMLLSFSTNVPSQFMIDSYQASDGLPIDESAVYDPNNPFENRDPRLDASIVRPQSIFGPYVYETHRDSSMTWMVVGGDSTRVANLDGTNPFASFTGYLWRKYADPQDFTANRANSGHNFILMRYAEVLHIYAEAKIEMNEIDISVLNAMNEIRARAYGVDISETDQYPQITTTNQEELRRELRNERKVEFAGEGFRWFDIRRWGIAEQVMNGPLVGRPIDAYTTIPSAPTIDDETGHPQYGALLDLYRNVEQRVYVPERDALWAIPQVEINVNENMTQNPGY